MSKNLSAKPNNFLQKQFSIVWAKKARKKKFFYYKIMDEVYKDKIKELDVLCIEWNLLTT